MKAYLKISTAAFVLASLGAGSAPAFAQDGAAQEDDGGIKEIIVTATRREESSNRVPLAIQALSGEALSELNVANFEDLVEYLPNVRTASRGPGISSVYIRGLSTDTAGAQILGVAGVQPTVALYLNDAPASTPGRNLDIYPADFERVEVLAGPQGTLFGASAMGGVIRYITGRPNFSEFKAGFNAGASTTKSGDPSFSVDGFINIPITVSPSLSGVSGEVTKRSALRLTMKPGRSERPSMHVSANGGNCLAKSANTSPKLLPTAAVCAIPARARGIPKSSTATFMKRLLIVPT